MPTSYTFNHWALVIFTLAQAACDTELDIAIILDASRSMKKVNFEKILKVGAAEKSTGDNFAQHGSDP